MSFARRNSLRVSTALAMALILAGCVTPAETPTAVDATTATVSTGDPLIAFVAGAAPGAEGANIGAGMPSRFRLTRSYSAASGAECREVQETPAGGVERLRLVCRDPNGQWREARPLLSNVYSRQ
ncbi:DVU3141 family protein [Plastoroseomonas arctica]|uniref:Common-antigen outer membrane protein n=1 Tax=Plastoroseomonas arctica TaxID=1509237 RepID=A0AAF1K121_9PROT|nr:DVU3141 family protein [Plastoroseomonas arctica]MBR0654365.1 hypothetical protein [Plastoroseomonas arctica]